MKNILVLLFCLFVATSYAQDSSHRIDSHLEKIVKLYEMDDAQAQQYKQIAIAKNKELMILQNEKSQDMTREEKVEAKKILDEKFEKETLAILNEKQKKIFEYQKSLIQNINKSEVKSPK